MIFIAINMVFKEYWLYKIDHSVFARICHFKESDFVNGAYQLYKWWMHCSCLYNTLMYLAASLRLFLDESEALPANGELCKDLILHTSLFFILHRVQRIYMYIICKGWWYRLMNISKYQILIFCVIHSYFSGILWEPCLQTGWPETLPHPSDPRYRIVWAVEDRQI